MSEIAGSAVQTGHADQRDLARFGYKQELHRSLGSFSSFAAGFSLISVLTGVFQLFGFGFAFAGPTVWWTWPVVFLGQLAVALCFAELASQYPLAGSVYQWSKRVTSAATSWMSGWLIIAGSIINLAALAVAWQVVLPQVSSFFQFVGSSEDAGTYITPGGAQNAIILGIILIAFTTTVNMTGVRMMARINNIGVAAELLGVLLLIVLLAAHSTRGPDVVTQSLGVGESHSWGLFGALLIGGLMSAYVMFGFDVASSLAEETKDPRRKAPPAILRALTAAFVAGGLLILVALMAVPNINDENIGVLGLPLVLKETLGETVGKVFLVDVAIAIGVCALALHAYCIRMVFAMARDERLPYGRQIARVSSTRKVPIVPSIAVGMIAIALLLVNLGNASAFVALTSTAVVIFYLAYLCVTIPLLRRRLRGLWPTPQHGNYFSLGRWGVLVNAVAVGYGALVAVNLAWPRREVYNSIGDPHWYFQAAAFLLIGFIVLVGGAYYFLRQRGRTQAALAEHHADVTGAEPLVSHGR